MLNGVAESDERERLQLMFEQAPGFMALLEGPDHRFAVANPAFRDLVGQSDLVGKTLADALPEFAQQGFVDLLDSVARSGEAFVTRAMTLRVPRTDGSLEEILVDLVLQPIAGTEQIFVQ